MRKIVYLSILLILILGIGLFFVPPAETSDTTEKLQSNLATIFPTIGDGIGTDWSDAYDNIVTLGGLGTANIYIKNIGHTLFIAIELTDEYDGDDYLYLFFDEENDESFKPLEMGGETVYFISCSGLFDHFTEDGGSVVPDTTWGGTNDGYGS